MDPNHEDMRDMAERTASGGAAASGSSQPLIYVVTACRNSEGTVGAAIESVLGQPHLGEYVLVDGASTDGTLAVIERYASAEPGRVRYVSETDAGIYDAMNKGIRMVLGHARPHDLVATLNSDDAYIDGALQHIATAAVEHPKVDVFFGDVALLDERGSATGVIRRSVDRLTRASAADGMPVEHAATFVRARVYEALGLYDTAYPIAADYDFIVRAIEADVPTLHVPQVITGFRFGGVSTVDERPSYKDAIRVRVAHGASPVFEWARYVKRRAFATAFAALKHVPGVAGLQARYGASTRGSRDERL